jgi:hypothetical protein
MRKPRSTDVLEVLRQQKAYHEAEIRKIERMLEAAKEETPSPVKGESRYTRNFNVQWTKHFRKIFGEDNCQLPLEDLKKALLLRGVADEKTLNLAYNTIVSTISRMIRNGELHRDESGVISRGPKFEEPDEYEDVLGVCN